MLSEEQKRRYARHIMLDEVGERGQERLLNSRVLVIGAGGLGSPMLLYLAAAGVGTLGIVDDDVVDLSNLQRQVIHTTPEIGTPKVDTATAAIHALNPDVRVETHRLRLDRHTILPLLAQYDLVADCTDNFPTRFLLNDACHLAGKTLVSAAIMRFDGQLSTFRPQGPCYRCIHHAPPPDGALPPASKIGVFGVVPGVLGTLQATEVLKELLELGDSMSGRLLVYDLLAMRSRVVKVNRDPQCPLCGDHPTIHDLNNPTILGY